MIKFSSICLYKFDPEPNKCVQQYSATERSFSKTAQSDQRKRETTALGMLQYKTDCSEISQNRGKIAK